MSKKKNFLSKRDENLLVSYDAHSLREMVSRGQIYAFLGLSPFPCCPFLRLDDPSPPPLLRGYQSSLVGLYALRRIPISGLESGTSRAPQ